MDQGGLSAPQRMGGGAEMTTPFTLDGQIGVELANRLGLQLIRREGHDLAGPCIACKSSDAFRLHQQTGVGYCYSCQGKWSPFQVAETVLGDRKQAKALLVELGVFQPGKNGACAKASIDPIEAIARQKGITAHSLRAFGAQVISSQVIRLPAYGPEGKQSTTFSMSVKGGKGRFQKGKPAGLFFPHIDGKVRLPQPGEVWHVLEGPKDPAALHGLGLLACGLNTCRLAAKFARLFADVEIVLVPDRDRPSEQGAQHSSRALQGIAKSIRIAVLPAEFKETKGEDVRDLLRRPNGRELVLQALEDSRPWNSREPKDQRPEIEVTPEEHEVNDLAINALARDPTLFHRGGALVHILHDHAEKTVRGISRPANAARIAVVREASLRERLSAVARFMKRKKLEEELVHVHPPAFCISAVAARGYWPGIRPLEGILSSPTLRSDGTVLQTPGYDVLTGLFYEPIGLHGDVSIAPTLDDAHAACKTLLEVIIDFPFAKAPHRAAWIAFVLTPLSRYAFHGPSPLFLIDANIRATGKSLLADAVSLIVTGRPIARMSHPRDDDEMRKRITAIALSGDQMVLIDNISGELNSLSLDAALTGVVWKDRILGRSEIVEMPLVTTWAATGNNVVLGADTSRRACHIRLDSKLENPEERADFRHRELLRWVRQERPRLLAAALTILAAYCKAGRPDQRLKTWGSFEGWSGLVRQAIVWAGLPDPGETREELARSSDREAAGLRALIQGWPEMDQEEVGLTAANLLKSLEREPDQYELLRSAVLELCPTGSGKLPSPRSLGNKLRHLRGRVVGGQALDKREPHGTAVWFVTAVGSCSDPGPEGCSGGSGCSESEPVGHSFGLDMFASHDGEPGTEQPEPPEQPVFGQDFNGVPDDGDCREPTSNGASAGKPWNPDRY
jgi:hypothetical protein